MIPAPSPCSSSPARVAESTWTSDDLVARAASANKTMHIVEGANHMSLYDISRYVDAAVAKLVPFFQAHL